MSTRTPDEELHARRKQVIGRLLLRAARVFQQTATERIRALGYEHYSIGDNAVLVHLEQRGNRISEIAERAGVTKQAISQLVGDLEKRNIVQRVPDPTDGRAQIVRFTDRGFAMMQEAFEVVSKLDDEFAEMLPGGALDEMRAHLTTLLDELDPAGF